jgi:hypothetical protein
LGKTIGELQSTMTQSEYLSWMEYYRYYPFDDYHRYHRPAALISQSMNGGDMEQKLNWLQPPAENDGLLDADLVTMRTFGFRKKAGG